MMKKIIYYTIFFITMIAFSVFVITPNLDLIKSKSIQIIDDILNAGLSKDDIKNLPIDNKIDTIYHYYKTDLIEEFKYNEIAISHVKRYLVDDSDSIIYYSIKYNQNTGYPFSIILADNILMTGYCAYIDNNNYFGAVDDSTKKYKQFDSFEHSCKSYIDSKLSDSLYTKLLSSDVDILTKIDSIIKMNSKDIKYQNSMKSIIDKYNLAEIDRRF